jgi:soluble lytic murein transglycosylase
LKGERVKFILVGLFIVSLTLGTTPLPLHADIYMYIDRDGIVHFTNAPTTSEADYRLYIKEKRVYSSQVYSPKSFDSHIRKAAEKYDVSYSLVKAIIKAESDFNPRAVSKKGALGLMQLMPENIRAMNIRDPFDPMENIFGGTRYFREMLDRFDGELPLSLAAYNAGPTAVERYNNSIPPYKETEAYVDRVLKFYYAFR